MTPADQATELRRKAENHERIADRRDAHGLNGDFDRQKAWELWEQARLIDDAATPTAE